MKQRNGSFVFFYTMGIAGLFLAGFFLLAVYGAKTYRSTVIGQTQNNQARALLSYFSVCEKSNDTEGAVTVSESEGKPVLVIRDGTSGYAIRVYQQGNRLIEDYGRLEAELNPEAAKTIGETEVFQVEALENQTFCITTDAGRTLFHVRSREAAADEE